MSTLVGFALPFLLFGALPSATLAGDLSKYREFQLGTDLSTIAKQTGVSPSQAKAIHSRPVLIQELEWRPPALGLTAQREPAKDVVFNFYDGQLFRIVVNYDRYETEGLTTEDVIEAMSATFGTAAQPGALAQGGLGRYGDPEEVVARWQDARYRFDLVRSSYGPTFSLTGVLKKLEAQAKAAILEASRLDDREAPQRDAARLASEDEAAKAKLQQSRLANKPKFRP